MKEIRERDIERRLVKAVKATSAGMTFKFWPVSVTGLPDRVVLWRGGICDFVEVKRPGGTASKIQSYLAKKLKGLGFFVTVIDSEIKIKEYINYAVARISKERG